MPVIKIPKQYLVNQDEDSITVDVPASLLALWQRDYDKVARAKALLKHKREAMLTHLSTVRQEWEV